MLGGQQQQEKEGQIRGGVADEFDEGLADKEAVSALGAHQVTQGEQRKEQADEDTGDKFASPVTSPPARKFIVPTRGQQLLAIWLCYKLERKRERDE